MASASKQTAMAPNASDMDRTGLKAGFVSRSVALIIDIVIILLLASATYLFIQGTLTLMRVDLSTCTRFVPIAGWRSLVENLCRISRFVLLATIFSIGPLYFVLLWLFAGRTVGMGICGLRVVRTNGKSLNLVTALARLLGYMVCVLTLGLGFLWALIDMDRQGLHDKIARTYIIYWSGVVKHAHPPPTVAVGGAAQQVASMFSSAQGSDSALAPTPPPAPES